MAPLLLSKILLRVGLAFTLLYAAFDSFKNPNDWIGFFPVFITHIISGSLLLSVFSVFEIALAIWLLSGKKSFYSGLVAALLMLGIVVFNLGAFDIVFRDLGLFFAALALVFLSR